MPPKRRKQKGKGIIGDAARKIKAGAKWIYDNRAGIKKAHDYIKDNKLASRGLHAVGYHDYAKKAEQRGYGCGCQGGAGHGHYSVAPPTRMRFAH